MIIVVNRKGHKSQPNDYYCGRPSPLGNPFPMKTEADRDRVCDQYRAWFDSQIKVGNPLVFSALNEIKGIVRVHGGVNLICFCAPRRCHCDTIKSYLESLL